MSTQNLYSSILSTRVLSPSIINIPITNRTGGKIMQQQRQPQQLQLLSLFPAPFPLPLPLPFAIPKRKMKMDHYIKGTQTDVPIFKYLL